MSPDGEARMIELLESIEKSAQNAETLLDLLVMANEETVTNTGATAYNTMSHWQRWRATWHAASEIIKQTEREGQEATGPE